MRKIFILLSALVLFQTEGAWVHSINNDVQTIYNAAVVNEGLKLDEWEVVFVEEMSPSSFQNIKNALQRDHSVIKEEDELLAKYVFQHYDKRQPVHYQIEAMIQKDKTEPIKLYVTFSGNHWSESVQSYYKEMTKHLKMVNGLEMKQSFTCVKLNDNGIMGVGFSIHNMMDDLYVQVKNKQVDKLKQSTYEKTVYGFSPVFNNTLQVNNEEINFQLTVKTMTNTKKQLIVGTPIILNEY